MRFLNSFVGVTGVLATISGARDPPELTYGDDWNYKFQGADWYLGPCKAATNRQSPVAFEFKIIPDYYSTDKSIKIAWNVIHRSDYSQIYLKDRKVAVKPREGRDFGFVVTSEDYKRFDLVDIHFHAPAEHTVGKHGFEAGLRYPLGADFVHKEHKDPYAPQEGHDRKDDGEVLVIGVIFKPNENAESNFVSDIADALVHGHHKELDIGSILDKKNGDTFLHYDGSLTSPPCTENVRWYVLKDPVDVQPDDLEEIAAQLRDPNDLGNFRLQQNLPPDMYFTSLIHDFMPPYPGYLNSVPVYKTYGYLVHEDEIPLYGPEAHYGYRYRPAPDRKPPTSRRYVNSDPPEDHPYLTLDYEDELPLYGTNAHNSPVSHRPLASNSHSPIFQPSTSGVKLPVQGVPSYQQPNRVHRPSRNAAKVPGYQQPRPEYSPRGAVPQAVYINGP